NVARNPLTRKTRMAARRLPAALVCRGTVGTGVNIAKLAWDDPLGEICMTNKILVRLVLVLAILSTLTLAAWLPKPSALHLATQAEAAEMSQDEFERRVHDYLLAHPEVVGEALYRLQEKQDEEAAAAGKAVLKAHAAEVFDDPDSPTSGNPKGDVTVVE